MKNRKKKTGMIPIVALIMILMAAVGLFPCEKALAAEQVKAVTAFHVYSQLSEVNEEYASKKSAGIPDPVWTERFYGTENPAGIPDPAGKAVKLPKIGIPHIELPEIDFSKLDKETEKGKLREALEEMDRMGISPKMLLRRAWNLVFPKGVGKQTGERADTQEAEPVTERVKKKASEEFGKAVDQTAEKVKEKASEELDKAVDQALGKEQEKFSDAIEQEAEKVKE